MLRRLEITSYRIAYWSYNQYQAIVRATLKRVRSRRIAKEFAGVIEPNVEASPLLNVENHIAGVTWE